MPENNNQNITELNNIIKEVITDAKNFAKDMTSSIYMYYFAGILGIIFGIQTGWYNQTYIFNYDPIPSILVAIQVFAGLMLIARGYTLKKKYTRIFDLNKKL
jgi:hypothetical protein